MTIFLSTLRDAAFHDRVICVDCGSPQPDDSDPEIHVCAFCDSPEIESAARVLSIYEAVDDGS